MPFCAWQMPLALGVSILSGNPGWVLVLPGGQVLCHLHKCLPSPFQRGGTVFFVLRRPRFLCSSRICWVQFIGVET